MAAFTKQMEEDEAMKGPEKEPSKVQGQPKNVMSWKPQERVINYTTCSKYDKIEILKHI